MRTTRRGRSIAIAILTACLTLAVTAFAFVGLERKIGEHDDAYTPFIKQAPTLRTIYVNTVACGMCDVPRFEDFSQDRKRAFADYCHVRFGIDDIRVCHAIFREQQIISDGQGGLRAPSLDD